MIQINLPISIYDPPVGTMDRKDVYMFKKEDEQTRMGFECYCFLNNTDYKTIACVVIDDTPSYDNVFYLRQVWIDDQHKKQGMGTLLILFILRKLCKRLILDEESIASDDVKNLILTAVEVNKIKAFKTKRLSRKELQNSFKNLNKPDTNIILEQSPVRYPLFCKDGLLAEGLLIEKENTYE